MALLTITTAGLRPLPLGLLSQSIPLLSRGELEDVIERLIDELDRRDGDEDLECNDLEDDFALSDRARGYARLDGAGCPISDPTDPAWIEWTAKNRPKAKAYDHEPMARTPWGGISHEDDEDDDPEEEDDHSGQCDEDGINTADLHMQWMGRNTGYGAGPGCVISDSGELSL